MRLREDGKGKEKERGREGFKGVGGNTSMDE
jgi:hypothetical protein